MSEDAAELRAVVDALDPERVRVLLVLGRKLLAGQRDVVRLGLLGLVWSPERVGLLADAIAYGASGEVGAGILRS